MNQHGEGIDLLMIHQDVHLGQVPNPVISGLIVETAVALGNGLELVVKIVNNFRQGISTFISTLFAPT